MSFNQNFHIQFGRPCKDITNEIVVKSLPYDPTLLTYRWEDVIDVPVTTEIPALSSDILTIAPTVSSAEIIPLSGDNNT